MKMFGIRATAHFANGFKSFWLTSETQRNYTDDALYPVTVSFTISNNGKHLSCIYSLFIFYQKGRIMRRVTMKTAANMVKIKLQVLLQPA